MSLNEITIEVTQQCPNRCIYCSSLSDINKTESLNIETIKQVVDDAVALGVKCISLSGGEPFLRKELVDIVYYIHSKDIKIRLYTSGIYLSEGQYTSIPAIFLENIKGTLDSLIFNYETIDADSYATIMGTEATNLSLLDETIKTAITKGIPVETHLVPMHCNLIQIPNLLCKLYSMGVSCISFLRIVPQGRVLENRELVELRSTEQEKLKQILTSSKDKYKHKIRLGHPFTPTCATCGTGTAKLTIRYDGYVFPCEAFKDGMMAVNSRITPDNVKEKNLKCIYENSSYLNWVREGVKKFSSYKINECCFGQYCRVHSHMF